jgi:hypothetical protein
MSSINDKQIIVDILENNGYYPGDPQIARAYSYLSIYHNNPVYAIYYEYRHDTIHESPYVLNPILLYDKKIGLTEAGEKFLKDAHPCAQEF